MVPGFSRGAAARAAICEPGPSPFEKENGDVRVPILLRRRTFHLPEGAGTCRQAPLLKMFEEVLKCRARLYHSAAQVD